MTTDREWIARKAITVVNTLFQELLCRKLSIQWSLGWQKTTGEREELRQLIA